MSENNKKNYWTYVLYAIVVVALIGLIYLILNLAGVFGDDKTISPKPLNAPVTVLYPKIVPELASAAAVTTPTQIPNTNEMINNYEQHNAVPTAPTKKSNSGTLASYKVYTGDIAGFDISKGEIGSLTFDQIADICTNRPFCNTFVISGNEYYLKNIPDGLVTTGNSSIVFTKAKITSSIPSKMSEYSLYMDCNVDNYDIPGYNDSSNGMDANELADLCYSIPNCNTVQGNKGMRKFKNVPDGATCSYESGTTTFSRAKNLNKPF